MCFLAFGWLVFRLNISFKFVSFRDEWREYLRDLAAVYVPRPRQDHWGSQRSLPLFGRDLPRPPKYGGDDPQHRSAVAVWYRVNTLSEISG